MSGTTPVTERDRVLDAIAAWQIWVRDTGYTVKHTLTEHTDPQIGTVFILDVQASPLPFVDETFCMTLRARGRNWRELFQNLNTNLNTLFSLGDSLKSRRQ